MTALLSDSTLDSNPFSIRVPTRAELIAEARKVIPETPTLINMVSKRVRQLSIGQRPLVDVSHRYSLGMIALKEIAEGKLQYKPGDSEMP